MLTKSINYFISVLKKHKLYIAIFITSFYAMLDFINYQRSIVILMLCLGLLLYCRAYSLLLFLIVSVSYLPHVIALGGGTQIKIDYFVLFFASWIIIDKRIIKGKDRGIPLNKFIIFFLLIAAANYFRRPSLPQIITGTSSLNHIQFAFFISILSFICIYLITPYILRSTELIKKLIILLNAFATIGLVFAFLDRFWNIKSLFVAGYRGIVFEMEYLYGSFVRLGYLGYYANMLLPAILTFVQNKLAKSLAVVGLFLSVILSGGRTSLLVFLCIIILYIWLSRQKIKDVLIAVTITCLLLVIIVFSPAIKYFPQLYRFSAGYAEKTMKLEGSGLGGRFGIWELSLKMIKENLIFGAGPATEAEVLSLQKYDSDMFFEAREGSHATYFNIPAIFGIPAFILYLIGVGAIVKKNLKQYKYRQDRTKRKCDLWLILVLCGILIGNIFEGRATGGNLYFYFILGMADASAIRTNMK